MQTSPNYIHFRVQWQMLGPESPGQRFERQGFQQFFEHLNADQRFGGYDDFSYRPDRCELAKARGTVPQGGQAFSKVAYANDTLSLVEEWTDHSTEEFAQKMKVVLDAWFRCFPQTLAVVQACSLRVLVTPACFSDSKEFLSGQVLRLTEAFQERLSEMPHALGFTFVCRRQVGFVLANLEAKIMSWRDNRALWIEVSGISPLREPLNAAKHDQAEAIFEQYRRFMQDEVMPLVNSFDRKRDE